MKDMSVCQIASPLPRLPTGSPFTVMFEMQASSG
jgi:hypothetical protein